MPDKPPDYTPCGFTDIWKGEYHGEPVCIKVARGRYLSELVKVKEVRRTIYSIGGVLSLLIPDIPSHGQRGRAQFSSKCAPCHSGFEWTVSGLHHEFVDARWEHLSVHQSKPARRSSDACMCLSVEVGGNNSTDYACNSLRKHAAASYIFMGWVFYTVASAQ